MNSFYGGKEGRTYHIVQRFDCIKINTGSIPATTSSAFENGIPAGVQVSYTSEGVTKYYFTLNEVSNRANFNPSEHYELRGMVDCFAQGGNYTGANYGQYVIIDTGFTTGNSNKENGLLYRRGFDYNQNGTPKPNPPGPGGSQEAYQAAWMNYISHPGGGAIYVGQIQGPIGKTPEIEVVEWDQLISSIEEGYSAGSTSTAIVTVPGAIFEENQGTVSSTFNDNVKAGYVNIEDANGDIIGAHISFEIPYPVFDITVGSTDPYTEASAEELEMTPSHPFYHKWEFNIPGGKKGDSVVDLSVVKGSQIIAAQPPVILDEEQEINQNYDYMVYSQASYQENENGDITYYLGRWPWNVIDSISVSSNGNKRKFITQDSESQEIKLGYLIDLDSNSTTFPKKVLSCISAGTLGSTENIPSSSAININQVWQGQNTVWKCIQIDESPVDSLDMTFTAASSQSFSNAFQNLDYLVSDPDGKIYAKYTSDEEAKEIATINSVRAMRNDGDTISVLYSDQNMVPSTAQKVIENWEDPVSGIIYPSSTWHNLGTLPAQYHIYGQVDLEWLTSHATHDLPEALHLDDENPQNDYSAYAGWLITVLDTQGDTHLYTYDYHNETDHSINIPGATVSDTRWYEVMKIPQQYTNNIVVSSEQPTTLTDGGYWFKISSGNHSHN